MTWKEFKEWVEEQGAKDDDNIRYFDFSWVPVSFERKEEDGEGEIIIT